MIKIISKDMSWDVIIEDVIYHFYYSNIEAIEGLNLDGFDEYEKGMGFKIGDKLITATREWDIYKKDFQYTLEIKNIAIEGLEEMRSEAWTKWEMEQLEKHDGEVFVEVEMSPIPWHGDNSRRYHIYNENSCNDEKFEEVNMTVDCEIIEEENSFKIIEI